MSDSESLTPKAPSREGLVKSTGVVSSMTLLSRVLGVVRDMVIANYFGASAGADSFFLAFRIPNFFRRLFGEGAFSQAFVPVLSQYRAEKTHEEVRGLVAAIGGSLG
ncbi:MAG: putative peptidoglycan lipid II flippase, partial [Planctomycetaceae bacterium]